jgi:hypothetical protein
MLPRAQVASHGLAGLARRGVDWMRHRLLASHFAGGLAGWAFSGAFTAGCALTLYAYWRAGAIAQIDMGRSLGVVLFASLGTMLLVWPFLISALIYLTVWRHGGWRSRPSAALWGAAFHGLAHMTTLQLAMASPSTGLVIPVALGALWGSWLPAMAIRTARSRFWLWPCPACGARHEPPSLRS